MAPLTLFPRSAPRPTSSIPRLLFQRARRRSYASSSTKPLPIAGASDAEVRAAEAYCSNLLRKYDSPSYTLSTFIPPPARLAYSAIRAFNIDIARIADNVSNPTVGAMRMQFWRDTITKTFAGSPPKEPVAILLASALDDLSSRTEGKSKMSKSWFLRVISAREQYLNNAPYPNLTALETYAENTYSTLLYLTLSALPLTSLTADHLASHIGKAAGITAVLRGLPLIAFPPPPNHHSNPLGLGGGPAGGGRQGAVTLSLDVLLSAGVKEEEVFRQGADAPGLRDAVFAVATRASDHLITARQMLKNLREGQDVGHEFEHNGEDGHEYEHESGAAGGSKSQVQLREVERGFGVLMPAVATQMWLDKLQKVDFDVFKPDLRRTDWKFPLKAYFAFNRRSF